MDSCKRMLLLILLISFTGAWLCRWIWKARFLNREFDLTLPEPAECFRCVLADIMVVLLSGEKVALLLGKITPV